MALEHEPTKPIIERKTPSAGRALWQRLGLKEDQVAAFLWAPPELIEKIQEGAFHLNHSLELATGFKYFYIHSFITSRYVLNATMPQILEALEVRGALWVSVANDKSAVVSDLTHRNIREICAAHGLLGKRIEKIDEVWSALKFQRDLKKRPDFREVHPPFGARS